MEVPEGQLTDEQLRSIYAWVDAIPLSRPKRNIARDFSDGVLLAEVVHAYFPDLVELHNYTSTSSTQQKIYNLEALNNRVFRKLNYLLTKSQIDGIVHCRAGAVENVLNALQFKMAKYREKRARAASEKGSPRGHRPISPGSHAPSEVSGAGRPTAKQPKHATAAPGNAVAAPAAQPTAKNPSTIINEQILVEKEQQIRELQETIEILNLKVSKLEQLVRLKDSKIQKLTGQQPL
jgi:hypothetical protein